MLSPVTLEKVKTFLLRGDRSLSFAQILKLRKWGQFVFRPLVGKFVYRILEKYLEIWMLYLLTQLGPAVGPKQI